MGVRKLMLAAVGLAAVATMTSAHADDVTPTEVAGYNNGLAGSLTLDGVLSHGSFTYRVNTNCTFAGALTPNNTLIVEYGGTAVASTNDAVRVPQITHITCTIKSGTLSASADLLLNGSASAVASSTLLDESGPKEWPVAPITVCASGTAVFGNSFPVIVRIPETCKTPTP